MLNNLPDDVIKIILKNLSPNEKLRARLIGQFININVNKIVLKINKLERLFKKNNEIISCTTNKYSGSFIYRGQIKDFYIYKKADTYGLRLENPNVHPCFLGRSYDVNKCVNSNCVEKKLDMIYLSEKKVNYNAYSWITHYNKKYIPYCVSCFKDNIEGERNSPYSKVKKS